MTTPFSASKKEQQHPKPVVPDDIEHRIVAIGASAGGLEALKEFFSNVPIDCYHSFVVIQHLSPDYKSLMADLLSKSTNLPIYEVKNNMKVEPASVYLIPPKKNMTIIDGILHLVNKPKGNSLNLPIDIFFNSLAHEYNEKAICVILSGTGSDGTSGARTIKEVGGMVMVQDPDQAKFDGMPRSAIQTGLVDYTLPVESMASELLHYIEHPTTRGESVLLIEEDEDTIKSILKIVREETGLDFQQYKRPTLVRRIARRISVNTLHNQKEYLDFIRQNRIESDILAREFLIGVTNFFRDNQVWKSLETSVIPDLVSSKKNGDVFKVWCVGSSTGEEAYSMAMIIDEEIERQNKDLKVKIFATDLASNHVNIGSRGIYPESIIANVSPARLKKFFTKIDDSYQVSSKLRKTVIFSQHNVLTDPPFNKMDISVCRNLLIYMQQAAQRKIIGLLHYSLNLNGILLLGSSESLGDYTSVFEVFNRNAKIYKNIKQAKSIGFEPLKYPDSSKFAKNIINNRAVVNNEIRMANIMNEMIADELGLAGVYIDEGFNILHAVGEFKKFVQLPEKGFSINLLNMVPPNVSITLAATVRKAFTKQERILYKSLSITNEQGTIPFDILVNPFEINFVNHARGCLLLFIPRKEQKGSATVLKDTSDLSNFRILELEEELKNAKENLNNVVEEVETSNEELQATNEELLASNEELQSTNEELQSVNEELHTVNAELHQKMEDLSALNSDMDNLLTSTDIGTIFIDTEMRIRKFTPAIRDHFSLRETDINRPISHFANNFDTKSSDFLERVKEVLVGGKMVQRELHTSNGKWFLKRVAPYFDNDKKIKGVVISFVDIDDIKKSEEKIKKSEQEFRLLYENAPEMFASFDKNGKLINCNRRLVENLGYKNKAELLKKHFQDFYYNSSEATKKHFKEFKRSGKMNNVKVIFAKKDGSPINIRINAQVLYDTEGNEIYSLASFHDISDLTKIEQELIDKNKAFEQLLEGTTAGYWDLRVKEGKQYLSPSYKAMFGYEDHEIDNSPELWKTLVHPEDLQIVLDTYDKHIQSKGEIPFSYQVRYFHKDGSIVWIYSLAKVIEWDTNWQPLRIIGSHIDITPLKTIEEELYRSNRELEQFAYVASHDLQEPLNTITDFVKLLEEEYHEKLEGDAQKYIEFILEAANRMSSLVKSVLSYSKIGKNLEKKAVDCNHILKDLKQDLKHKILETKTTITHKKLPVIHGYEIELHSLFFNLISNSIKFRRENHPPKISIKAEELESHWKFCFEDNGIGVSKNNQKKVFNIFQRLNNMDSFEGTGIGLAQCKKITELHGGKIWIDSSSKSGTKFCFTIKKL